LFHDLTPIEHKLQRLAQPRKVQRSMLHFEGDTIELRSGQGNGAFDVDGRK
jgi:hypothetical protein